MMRKLSGPQKTVTGNNNNLDKSGVNVPINFFTNCKKKCRFCGSNTVPPDLFGVNRSLP
ncbi:hypothetical protein GQ43DRAFT_439611 [Delitschia confertaspora ATCC 74209]|uniref:Uncharacterized protein n=1 Tax=Delitschia confertaspora ATCC 74209 TaxID=1513339 RepID=A0A9P4JQK5_9PLEO|nr:hypothetical protein GQ43DRAFT_439611 [Delitschia confertaspora ATCC 74209]